MGEEEEVEYKEEEMFAIHKSFHEISLKQRFLIFAIAFMAVE